MEFFLFGVVFGTMIALPIGVHLGVGKREAQYELKNDLMEQAQQRHREAMNRREQRVEFVHDCVDELKHTPAPADILGFCERQANGDSF